MTERQRLTARPQQPAGHRVVEPVVGVRQDLIEHPELGARADDRHRLKGLAGRRVEPRGARKHRVGDRLGHAEVVGQELRHEERVAPGPTVERLGLRSERLRHLGDGARREGQRAASA